MTEILFAYDSSRQMLVFADPAGSGRPVGVAVRALREAGWKVTEEGLRGALPRFDTTPQQVQVAPDMRSAQALAKSLNGMRGARS
jgi:hypothetical protein